MREEVLVHLGAWARAEAPRLGLRADRLRIRRVLSRGGFGTLVLRVHDGAHAVYLKAADAEAAEGLARWATVADRLEARYHAPPVLGYWPVGAAVPAKAVLASQGVEARPLGPRGAARILPEVLTCLGSLHRDSALAARLGLGQAHSLRATFFDSLGVRLREDLAEISRRADHLPAHVRDRLALLHGAAADLDERVRQEPAFAGTTRAVTHGDPHWHNLLTTPRGEHWHLLDWDDLALGDVALDLAVVQFGWVVRHGARGLEHWSTVDDRDPFLARRVRLYTWASILDLAIDPLSDLVAADDWVTGADLIEGRRRLLSLHERGWQLFVAPQSMVAFYVA
jgi:aminoglycoside phosphotransferase (APT) family kinase protein